MSLSPTITADFASRRGHSIWQALVGLTWEEARTELTVEVNATGIDEVLMRGGTVNVGVKQRLGIVQYVHIGGRQTVMNAFKISTGSVSVRPAV